MKNGILVIMLLTFKLVASQSLNNFKAVVIPLKFDFTKTQNQYRLATLSKINLVKAGFEAYYSNESGLESFSNNCDLLYYDVINEKSFLTTKLYFILKDCKGKIVYQSGSGISKEKDYQIAYTEALNKSFSSLSSMTYKYSAPAITSNQQAVAPEVVQKVTTIKNAGASITATNDNFLFAQPIANGFQLIDHSPKVIMKIYITSDPNCFIAFQDNAQGVLVAKNEQWFFEYYRNEMLISNRLEIKF